MKYQLPLFHFAFYFTWICTEANIANSHICECRLFLDSPDVISCQLEEKTSLSSNASKDYVECFRGVEHTSCYSATVVKIWCSNDSFDKRVLQNLTTLRSLSIFKSNLKTVPIILNNEKFSLFNLSENHIETAYFPSYANLSSLEVLDLSRNKLSEVVFEPESLPKLAYLHLQKNNIKELPEIEHVPSLRFLDVSYNPVSLVKSKLYSLKSLITLILHSIPSVSGDIDDFCTSDSFCQVLPSSLKMLDLSNNSLKEVPSCNGLLIGVRNLQLLDLSNNHIAIISEKTFYSFCFSNLNYLSLQNNRLIEISPNFSTGLHHLQTLFLNDNYLQHISANILQKFLKIKSIPRNRIPHHNKTGLYLHNNQWSCDCFQKELRNWLVRNENAYSIVCEIPLNLHGNQLQNLTYDQLECTVPDISQTFNVSVNEYHDAQLGCEASGIPKPLVTWYSPNKELISIHSLADSTLDDTYALSPLGEILTVKNVRLHKTGIYRCVANNSFGIRNRTESSVALSVVLSHASTIAYIVLACAAFMVAIVLNSVNMCMYIYEHVQAKRKYQKALQKQDEEEKENPPIRTRSRSLDESVASLNANRHYGKYDFTCQQMFLDTVVKGAHSVKKTLYDARHSEFSNNMWGYAANLRDRLHIEMPSQLPTLSMPNISMPNISMPSIPTMQDINTNIEKLGSSVMSRSHNLATSVGSVFTLKRWMQQSNNSSDAESRDSDENLHSRGVTSVKVDVHKCPMENSDVVSSDGGSTESVRVFTSRDDIDEEPRCSKSLPDYRHRRSEIIDGIRFTRKPSKRDLKSVKFESNEESGEMVSVDSPVCQSIVIENPSLNTISEAVGKSCHSYETSV